MQQEVKVVSLTPSDINQRSSEVAKELSRMFTDGPQIRLYGVPGGGSIAAWTIAATSTSRFIVVSTPEEADAIVIDMLDCYEVMDYYVEKYNKPFRSLYYDIEMSLYVFPWEDPSTATVKKAHLRLDKFYGESMIGKLKAAFCHIIR